ncbi:hypothetical protein [Synechococcus sp. M16.1]|uniref:hypothetical protein n=1 Tax=Synechococcus sp. M16.1 TaxID=1442553 RepID=UPI001644B605|nr:hypothetical protein [Synechococcus sp. M16.1]
MPKGYTPTIFAPKNSIAKIRNVTPILENIENINFETRMTIKSLKDISSSGVPDWVNRLPPIEKYDKIICDNLPEILLIRNDAIISAQFFWHDIIPNISESYGLLCDRLLSEYKPEIIGCQYFSMPKVRCQPGFRPVKPYLKDKDMEALKRIDKEKRDSLLITCGTTDAARDRYHKIISEIIKTGNIAYREVYVDSELMPIMHPKWMKKATYSFEMFSRLKACICRPGLGILNDVLPHQIDIRCIYEKGNKEMQYNAGVVESIVNKDFEGFCP